MNYSDYFAEKTVVNNPWGYPNLANVAVRRFIIPDNNDGIMPLDTEISLNAVFSIILDEEAADYDDEANMIFEVSDMLDLPIDLPILKLDDYSFVGEENEDVKGRLLAEAVRIVLPEVLSKAPNALLAIFLDKADQKQYDKLFDTVNVANAFDVESISGGEVDGLIDDDTRALYLYTVESLANDAEEEDDDNPKEMALFS